MAKLLVWFTRDYEMSNANKVLEENVRRLPDVKEVFNTNKTLEVKTTMFGDVDMVKRRISEMNGVYEVERDRS